MKRFLLVVMLFASAASLYAAELKVSGDMEVRGVMDGYDDGTDDGSYNYFDYDLTINAALVANENATVFTRFAFDRTVDGTGYVGDSAPAEDTTFEDSNTDTVDVPVSSDQFIAIERAYLNYKFAPFLQLNTGLMGGGQWGTEFGNKEVNIMRVQLIGALSEDMIFILTYQKDDEGVLDFGDDNEKDDYTTYYASAKLKFGAIKVEPLLVYATKGVNYEGAMAALFGANTYDISVMAIDLSLSGDMGMFGFEAEAIYKTTDDSGLNDDNAATIAGAYAFSAITATQYQQLIALNDVTYGAYINVWAKLAENAKAGAAFVYGSADEEDGVFTFGKDFDFTLVLDDVYDEFDATEGLGGNGSDGMAVKLYGEGEVMPKVTVGGCFAYYLPTDKDIQGDYSAWEVDVNATYAFDANASYTIAFGYATIAPEVGDDVALYELYHSFNVKF